VSARQPKLVLTERGEWVRDAACALLAFIIIPAEAWAVLKLVGL